MKLNTPVKLDARPETLTEFQMGRLCIASSWGTEIGFHKVKFLGQQIVLKNLDLEILKVRVAYFFNVGYFQND